jgi:guanylate kinase
LVVISAPSGGGKTTIIRRVLRKGDPDFRYSVSATTRPRRPGEQDGEDYYFLSPETFMREVEAGNLVEWAQVHGYFYGTPREPIDRWLEEGKIVLLDLDVHGGLAVKEQYPDNSLLIFVAPPSLEQLEQRLRARRTEDEEEIQRRLSRVPDELEKAKLYDVRIVNEDLNQTVEKVLQTIRERHDDA